MPKKHFPKKVIILGSGALKIGEAGEFDYSGSQAIKALKEENIKTVLINPNIATVQTDPDFADKVYFLPVTPHFVEQIIKIEKPDAIFLSFGGQTALNCGLTLDKSGVLKKHNVRVLGTPTSVIEMTEDRAKFNAELTKVGMNFPESFACTDLKSALVAAKKIGYPVLTRAAFTLGGQGSGFANDEEELKILLEKAFSYSPQVLIEQNLKGWKEVEYEVVRDNADNCITICNMENFDPLGVHTGESIVVAPSQTLTNDEYHMLRTVAIKVIRHLGIIGECNIQYALSPNSKEYKIIEVNARLSRSSALASKATGYPLAFVAAKLGIGYTLPEVPNSITQITQACFEPALDYIVVKFPRWDLEKFDKVKFEIGSEMKSVGEVMAIGKSFEEAIQKAIRSLEIGANGFVANEQVFECSLKEISVPTHKRIFAVGKALKDGKSVDHIHNLSKIDKFFLHKLKNIMNTRFELEDKKLSKELLLKSKKQGFSDKQIAILTKSKEDIIRKKRMKLKILPKIKQIDTLAAEFPAQTNYLYTTYHGTENDIEIAKKENRKKVLVLGSGSYRIGSSVEFDWCCVNCVKTFNKLGYETIMLNYNPETVSTDYDICDKLYFDEITLEKVLDIYEHEKPFGIVLGMGGQIANNLALPLKKAGLNILGTTPEKIDMAEDRNKFSKLLDKINVDQPLWSELTSLDEAKRFAKEVAFPVLIRPSYVLSGAAMRVCTDQKQLTAFLKKAADISKEHPVVISKFEEGAKEIEIDGVAQDGKLIIYAISEHVENAGVHSGDATIVLPPQKLYLETIRRIKQIMKKIINELSITGPFNIQFLAKNNDIKVIECNLRASRSFPFVSKVTTYNFIEIATKAILGKNVKSDYVTIDLDYVGVKAPQFSFARLKGADPRLGVEMASTGEVACFGNNLHQAFLKSLLAIGLKLPKKNILVTIGKLEEKLDFVSSAKKLKNMGYSLYATQGTHNFLKEKGVKSSLVHKVSENISPNILTLLEQRKFDMVINSQMQNNRAESSDGYTIRRKSVDLGITLINNIKVANLFVESLEEIGCLENVEVESYDKYRK